MAKNERRRHPMATRDGSATWQGDLKGGSGSISVASGLFTDGTFSFGTRFEEGPGTNPEELIGAAHAGCFSMALSNALAEAGHTADEVRTTAHVHLRFVDGAPTITKIELETHGTVSGIDQAQFEDFANQAKAGCVVSRALAGVEEITLQATLDS
jgi:osmotically inducible protein OsmC